MTDSSTVVNECRREPVVVDTRLVSSTSRPTMGCCFGGVSRGDGLDGRTRGRAGLAERCNDDVINDEWDDDDDDNVEELPRGDDGDELEYAEVDVEDEADDEEMAPLPVRNDDVANADDLVSKGPDDRPIQHKS
jgi:hypothetical protein